MTEEIRKIFFELKQEPVEPGFARLVEDIDIDVNYYEGYIAGIVASWLEGKSIPKNRIDRGEDLNERLDQIIERLLKLRERKQRIDHMVSLLLGIQ